MNLQLQVLFQVLFRVFVRALFRVLFPVFIPVFVWCFRFLLSGLPEQEPASWPSQGCRLACLVQTLLLGNILRKAKALAANCFGSPERVSSNSGGSL